MVLTTTTEQDLVLDPFAGVSSSLVAAVLRNRRACGAEVIPEYVEISRTRIEKALRGELPIRPTGSPVYSPNGERVAQLPFGFAEAREAWK
jgi:adenine-specific DNA-methyltransferase